jgi:hypothetical protein
LPDIVSIDKHSAIAQHFTKQEWCPVRVIKRYNLNLATEPTGEARGELARVDLLTERHHQVNIAFRRGVAAGVRAEQHSKGHRWFRAQGLAKLGEQRPSPAEVAAFSKRKVYLSWGGPVGANETFAKRTPQGPIACL